MPANTPPIEELIAHLKRELDRHMTPPLWFAKLTGGQKEAWFFNQRRACDMLAYELWRVEQQKQELALSEAMMMPRPHTVPVKP